MKERTQLLVALAAIVIAATAVVWVALVPDEPEVALSDSAAAALFASVVLLGKIRREHWQK
jgi:3-deoxy-D-arabino-heptulosonate 7-phosphate (DAHP) synthase